MQPEKQREFPWHYFDGPTDTTAEAVVRWIYAGFAGRAYQGFLEQGRGLLVGPFLTDHNKEPISTEEFRIRRAMGGVVGITVLYVSPNSGTFESTLPDEVLRQQLVAAVAHYDPEQECIVLLLANYFPVLARIVGQPLSGGGHVSLDLFAASTRTIH